jgi:hypothetical protein
MRICCIANDFFSFPWVSKPQLVLLASANKHSISLQLGKGVGSLYRELETFESI